MTDKVDEAIKATVQVRMAQIGIALLGRQERPAQLAMPEDITDLELLNIIAVVLQTGDQLRAKRPASRILVPN